MYKPWVREIIVAALREKEQVMLGMSLLDVDENKLADLGNDVSYLRSIIAGLSDQIDRYHTTGFMCKIDWECELGMAAGGTKIYSDIEDLKEHRTCVENCGIVEVVTSIVRVVQESTEGE